MHNNTHFSYKLVKFHTFEAGKVVKTNSRQQKCLVYLINKILNVGFNIWYYIV